MPKTSALPKYIQVSEMLIREIAAGHLRDGARLPPERDMANDLSIAVGTLRKALADVEAKGLLDRIHGSGNYVKHRPAVDSVYAFFRLELHRGGGLPTAEIQSVDRMMKPADAPYFGPDQQAHRMRRLRSLDGVLVAVEEIWLDGSQRDIIEISDLSESLYHFYRHDLGLVIGSVEDRIGVDAIPHWTSATFHLRPGQTAGYIERVSRTVANEPAEFSRTWFDAGRAAYISRMGKG